MTRKDKLEKALAYDDEMASRAAINGRPIIINHETLKFREAASWENARLAPLHAALLEAVEALEYLEDDSQYGEYVKETLAKLDKVLEEK